MNPIVTATAGTLLRSPLSSPMGTRRKSWADTAVCQLGKPNLTVPSTVSHSSTDVRRGSHDYKRDMFAYSTLKEKKKENSHEVKKKKKLKFETNVQKQTNQEQQNKHNPEKKKLKDVAMEVQHQKSKKSKKQKDKCTLM